MKKKNLKKAKKVCIFAQKKKKLLFRLIPFYYMNKLNIKID